MIYECSGFSLDTKLYCLKRNGKSVPVEPQVFDLLIYMIENRNRVVTRDELLDNLWHGRVVTDSAINARLKQARKAVGDNGKEQAVIKTIHGRGYQFIDKLAVVNNDPDTLTAATSIHDSAEDTANEIPSIAVLKFSNLSDEPDQGYFSDGITKNIYSGLSRVGSLVVKFAFSYNVKDTSVSEIAQELEVRYLLTGAVQKEADRVRVFAELIECETGETKWSERYDRFGNKVIDIQDDIASAIIATLSGYRGKINEIEYQHLSRKTAQSFNAYDCILKGIEHKDRYTQPDSKKSHYYFDQAKILEPDNTEPLGWSAWAHIMDIYMGWTDDYAESLELAYKNARRAISLDKYSEVGNWSLAICLHLDEKNDQAIEMIDKALEINPNNPDIMVTKGTMLSACGRAEEGAELILQAMRFHKHFPEWYYWELGVAYFCNNQFAETIKSLNRLTDHNIDTRIYLAASHALCKNHQAADAQLAEIYRINPQFNLEEVSVTHSYLHEEALSNLIDGLTMVFNSNLKQSPHLRQVK